MSRPHQNPWHDAQIERRFVDIEEGQVHVRVSRASPPADHRPLLMIHASPASAMTLVPIMKGLGESRRCYAPDTLGFGNSAPPAQVQPEIADYADTTRRLIDALDLDQVDVYGSHTGAHTAVELAISCPDRVRRVILDGIALFEPEQKQRMLANYAPEISPDMIGSQFHWAWHFIRDQALFFPYFDRDKAHLRGLDMANAETLHWATTDVLMALTTYQLGYRAAFRHNDRERLPLVRHRTLVTADVSDPLNVSCDIAHGLLPDSVCELGPSSEDGDYLRRKVAQLQSFLDS
jgi:pimeloyl-ACP methyl ester carboxylesterase